MSEIKEYQSSFKGPEIDALLTKVKDGSLTAAIEKELAEKADKSGYYPQMSVGFADDLVGRGESVPAEFSFRASGGKSIKDGAARIKRLKGNSVVWNQKVKELSAFANDTSFVQYMGLTYTYDNSSNILTINGTSTGVWQNAVLLANSVSAHIYFLSARKVGGTYTSVGGKELEIHEGFGGVVATPESSSEVIGTLKGFTGMRLSVGIGCGVGDVFDNYQIKIQYINLTQMFGAGNEPTTIEEFNARKPIVEDEYAYNEGEVIHMTAEGIKSVGDNAWDEEWRNGHYASTSGMYNSSSQSVCNVNPIRVLPSQEYYNTRAANGYIESYAFFYDSDMNFISYTDMSNGTFTTPANSVYMNFYFAAFSYGTTYNNDIMITLVHSGWKQDTDAGYQPYWEDRLIFDQRIKDEFPDGMSKWDMVYNKNGKGYIVHGLGVEDMGDLNWSYQGVSDKYPYGFLYTNLNKDLLDKAIGGAVLCKLYANGGFEDDKSIGANSSNTIVYVKDSSYTDAATFKAEMAGVPLYYELAEPTIIEYDEPFNLDYKVADFGTEQAIAEQPSAPISADIIYQFNAVDMIREHELEIAELQSIIATMQAQLASLMSNNE